MKNIGDLATMLEDELFKTHRPHTFIQWKGTDVCMDFTCVCGACSHFDEEFLYFVKCVACDRIFVIGTRVVAVQVTPEHVHLMADVDASVIHAADEGKVFQSGRILAGEPPSALD